MPWPLIHLAPDEWLARHRNAPGFQPLEIGHCAYAPWLFTEDGYHYITSALGSRYRSLPEPRRAPIIIALPYAGTKYQIWVPDQQAWNSTQGNHGEGWLVTGELPRVTITPSINCVGTYHGFVTEGVIADDCEGRKFS
jgi:hypothetical protein